MKRGVSVLLRSISLLGLASGLFWGGCTRPRQPETPTAAVVSDADLDTLWSATLMVLSRMDLVPERQDRASGIIESLPTTSQHFFEFWRHDVADPYSFAQADLQTIQRRATIHFQRDRTTKRWQMSVQVDVARLESPERQMTSTSAALQLYTSVLPTTEGLLPQPIAAISWTPIGRDAAMEQLILERILRIAGTSDYEYAPTGGPQG